MTETERNIVGQTGREKYTLREQEKERETERERKSSSFS